MLWGRAGSSPAREPGGLVAAIPSGAVRIFATGREIDASGAASFDIEMKGKVGISTGKPRTVGEIEAVIRRRRGELEKEAARHGDLAEAYDAIRASIGWSTIYEPQHDRVMTTVSREWNKWFGGYVIFGWDNFFIPYACSLFNRELAYAQLRRAHAGALTPAGMIPNVDETGGGSSWDRSRPPVGST